MFPYEDSEIVCLFPCLSHEKKIPSVVNISHTVVNDTSMEWYLKVGTYYNMETQIFQKKMSKLNFD